MRYAVDVHQFVRLMACMVRFTIAGGVRLTKAGKLDPRPMPETRLC